MALTGSEVLYVQGVDGNGQPAASTEQTTTGAIAALASLDTSADVITALTTVGNGTITAPGIVGKNVARSGPTAAFTDTTAAAALLLAALPSGAAVGTSFKFLYQNNNAYTATITGGLNVTVSGITSVPPNMSATFLVTYSATTPAFTMVGVSLAMAQTNALTQTSLTDIINTDTVRLQTAQAIISTTTPVALTGLSVTLTAGGVYSYIAELPVTTAGGGVLVATTGSATATNFQEVAKFFTAAGVAVLNTTTLAGVLGETTSCILAELAGVITVATGGTFGLAAAQNASTSVTTTLLANGFLQVTRIS